MLRHQPGKAESADLKRAQRGHLNAAQILLMKKSPSSNKLSFQFVTHKHSTLMVGYQNESTRSHLVTEKY